jgi:methionyl-tRNA synthetase
VSKLAYKNNIYQFSYDPDMFKILCPKNNIFYAHFVDGYDAVSIEKNYINTFDFQTYMRHRYDLIQSINTFMQKEQPWLSLKTGNLEQSKKQISFLLYMIKNCALLTAPFFIQ